MSRAIKYYEPEHRRYGVANNLQCGYCGNTTAFYMNLKFRHELCVEKGSLNVSLNQQRTQHILDSISKNIWDMISKSQSDGKEIFFCANCDESESVDLQERLIDYCWQMGCPGCEVCGNYISEEELRDLCTECINERNGEITEEDCMYSCSHFDNGLIDVFNHYDITLEDLKKELGY